MRWKGNRESNQVDDYRGSSASSGGGGSPRLLMMAFRFLGFKKTAILAVGLGAYGLFTGNLGPMLNAVGLSAPSSYQQTQKPIQQSASEKQLVNFVSVILADTEDTWTAIFKQQGKTYKKPRLVLFRNTVKSACGMAQSATGPFYCPADQKVYIDLSFYQELATRFKAPGDFAQAYVLAHEVGHHIQTLTGVSKKVHAAKRKLSTVAANKLSVKQELQADCLAGVWANYANKTRQLLEAGDVEEGLQAATAIGDDTLQKQARGTVSPDSFTHGSSAQRVKWFKAGLSTGDMKACNTFARVK